MEQKKSINKKKIRMFILIYVLISSFFILFNTAKLSSDPASYSRKAEEYLKKVGCHQTTLRMPFFINPMANFRFGLGRCLDSRRNRLNPAGSHQRWEIHILVPRQWDWQLPWMWPSPGIKFWWFHMVQVLGVIHSSGQLPKKSTKRVIKHPEHDSNWKPVSGMWIMVSMPSSGKK